MTSTATAIPTYLNNEFFREALSSSTAAPNELVIRELDIVRNTTGGNYCSDIYHARVKYVQQSEDDKQEHVAHLLVKDLFKEVAGSSNEYFTYKNILPIMNKLLCEAGIQRAALSPNLYLSRKSSGEVHVFDDMNELGYIICDRLIGFNAAQSKKIMEKLAHFHASSMIFMHKHPEITAKLGGFFWQNNPQFTPFIEHVIDGNANYIADIVAQWPGYEHIAQKMRQNMGAVFAHKFLNIFEPNATKLRVVTHSDLWIKNILILETADKTAVLDAVFIDYQNCLVGSPALDINNFFMTSVQLDVLRNERDNLIEYYHSVLIETLRKCNAVALNIELPTLAEIHKEILRTEYFTYYDLIFAFPQTNLSEELAKDMNYTDFFQPKRLAKNREDMFSNRRVLDTLRFVLKRLDKIGILN